MTTRLQSHGDQGEEHPIGREKQVQVLQRRKFGMSEEPKEGHCVQSMKD